MLFRDLFVLIQIPKLLLGSPLVNLKQLYVKGSEAVTFSEIFLGLSGLLLQRSDLTGDLTEDVVDADKIRLLILELFQGGCFSPLEFHDACRFIEELSAFLRFAAEDLLDLSLSDNGIAFFSDSRVIEKLVDVAEPAAPSVELILAFAGAIKLSHDRHFVRVKIELPVGVIQRDGDHGESDRLPVFRSGENNVLHIAAAQRLGALFSENPADRIADIAFARPVWTDNSGDTIMKFQPCSERKGFEALHFD